MNNEPMQEAAATIHIPHVCRTWNDALDAAEAAVERAHDWYELSEGLEGRAMMKCDALAAIRALKEKP